MSKSITSKQQPSKLDDFKEIIKLGLSTSVVFTTICSYLLATEKIDYTIIVLLGIGGLLMVGASNTFNQVIEKDIDALMERTKNRPIPQKRLSTRLALTIAVIFTITGLSILYYIQPKCALYGAISIFLYTSVYTPLKTITPLCVFVGAIPGAIPYMLGWVAATGKFGIEAGFLFLIQFFWQFPHFWAIGWIRNDDYKKAGLKMLPLNQKNKATISQIIFYTCIMILISIAPVFKLTGSFFISPITAFIILIIGMIMLVQAIKLFKNHKDSNAKNLMISSIFFISVVPIIYTIDKFLH